MNNPRDQKTYDLFQQYRFTFVMFVIVRIAGNLEAPYSLKPSVSGVHGYAPRSMAVIVFMMEELHLPYRGMVGYLNAHRKTLEKLGLNNVPSKSTIHRVSARIPESYYRQMHFRVIASIVAGDLAGDSSGFPMRKFIPWFSVRKNSHMLKKGWRKLHIIIDIRTRVILDYRTTHAYKADAPVMEDILNDMIDVLYRDIGDVCFDAAYLTRKICNMVSKMGGTPYIKPKSNTISKSYGSHSWRVMVLSFMQNRDEFDEHYHQRSIVESVFAALKERRGRGGSLRSRRTHTQDRELAIQTISYNIDMVSREWIKSGRLTKDTLKAIAAR